MNSKKNILFYSLFIISFLAAVFKVVIHLKFFLLPIFFTVIGFVSYFLNKKISIYLFLFFFPFINSFPDIFNSSYPYNYMLIPLFYLSGIVISSIFTKERLDCDYTWFKYYKIFLILLFISSIFVFVRWTNITIPSIAFFRDTPVTPDGDRISFSSIFPVITLALFTIPPFIFFIIKKNKLNKDRIINMLLAGFSVSFVFALIQRLIYPEFLSKKYWYDIGQFNGGSSDFNAFGFFSGFMFLILTIKIINTIFYSSKTEKKRILLYALSMAFSVCGIILSGSRTSSRSIDPFF